MMWMDYESVIYTVVLLIVYLLGLAICILLFHVSIPFLIAVQQILLVSISIPIGIYFIRRFRKTLYSFVGVLSNTSVVPLAAAAVTGGGNSGASEFMSDLELFTGEPNF